MGKLGGISLVLAIAALGLSVWSGLRVPHLAYVHNTKLFNEFAYKKELEKELQRLESAKKGALDSLRLDLELKLNTLESKKGNSAAINEYKIYEQQYLLKQKQYTEDYDNLAKKYTEQVWKQLNQYVKEYGEENDYTIIFGTTTSGEVMYAKEGKDLTDEILLFANNRFQGTLKK